MPLTERELVALAIVPEHRARFFARMGSERTRRKLRNCLDHSAPLDAHCTTWYRKLHEASATLQVEPDAPTLLVSSDASIDGASLPFALALDAVVASGFGTIIGISSDLAVFSDQEQPARAAVIRRARVGA